MRCISRCVSPNACADFGYCRELNFRPEKLVTALQTAEQALGENLTWLADKLDLQVRQKDSETLAKLAQLEAAWKLCVLTLAGKV